MAPDRDRYTRDARRAVLAAARTEHDFAGWLASVLASVAGQLGSSDALLAGRPGSWEASHVRALLSGTVGDDDRYLPVPRGLTDQKARRIWEMAAWGETPTGARIAHQEIAEEFGVSVSTVSDIAAGRTWKWLAEGDENA